MLTTVRSDTELFTRRPGTDLLIKLKRTYRQRFSFFFYILIIFTLQNVCYVVPNLKTHFHEHV